MKKVAVISVTASLLALCLVAAVFFLNVGASSQTSSQPVSSTPAASTPSSTMPASTAPAVVNRPVSRWVTTNKIMLDTLLYDAKKLLFYISDMQLGYADETCQQIRCDINTMRGVPPPNTTHDYYYFPPGEYVTRLPLEEIYEYLWSPIPRNWMMWARQSYQHYSNRYLQGVPSGVECPPIPEAQAAADLHVGLAQLETAVNSMENGINDSNQALLLGLEQELKTANETLQKVQVDLQKVQ